MNSGYLILGAMVCIPITVATGAHRLLARHLKVSRARRRAIQPASAFERAATATVENEPRVASMSKPGAVTAAPLTCIPDSVTTALSIAYCDATGTVTRRGVSVYGGGATDLVFHAFCDIKNGRRTFMFSRVRHAIDPGTGEYLTCAQVFQRVHPGRNVPDALRTVASRIVPRSAEE